ncbi:hypothetical protein cypCar_00044842, partial [Cyprinus carpio]
CARSIDGAVELYKRENPFGEKHSSSGTNPSQWRACARGLQTVSVETDSQSAPHPIYSTCTRQIHSRRETKTSPFLLESGTDRGIYFGKTHFANSMKKSHLVKRGLQDLNQPSSQPDKVGWIRRFSGKGIFREIWRNRFVMLKGDHLYIFEKEVSY